MTARRTWALLVVLGVVVLIGFSIGAPAPSVRASGASIRTDRTTYQIGDTVQICYTVPGPGPFTITDVQGGTSTVVISAIDDGTGGCLSGSIGPPAGQECEILSTQGGTAETCFQVVSSGTGGSGGTGGTGGGGTVPPVSPIGFCAQGTSLANAAPGPGATTVRVGQPVICGAIWPLNAVSQATSESFNFGDGTPPTVSSQFQGATHVYSQPGTYTFIDTMTFCLVQNRQICAQFPTTPATVIVLPNEAPPPTVSVSVDRGNGATYHIGDPITICFSVNSSAANASAVATLTEAQTGVNQTDFSGAVPLNQQQCASGTVGPPSGPDTVSAAGTVTAPGQSAQVGGASTRFTIVAQTQTCPDGSQIPMGQSCPVPHGTVGVQNVQCSPNPAQQGQAVTCSANISNPAGTSLQSVIWQLSDGPVVTLTGSSVSQSVTHTYSVGGSYGIGVSATDSSGDNGQGSTTEVVNAPAAPTCSPSTPAPTNLQAAAIDRADISLSWTDSSNGACATSILDVNLGQGATVGPGVTSTTISGLNSGTQYCYVAVTITGYDSSGNVSSFSNWGNQACATTTGSAPLHIVGSSTSLVTNQVSNDDLRNGAFSVSNQSQVPLELDVTENGVSSLASDGSVFATLGYLPPCGLLCAVTGSPTASWTASFDTDSAVVTVSAKLSPRSLLLFVLDTLAPCGITSDNWDNIVDISVAGIDQTIAGMTQFQQAFADLSSTTDTVAATAAFTRDLASSLLQETSAWQSVLSKLATSAAISCIENKLPDVIASGAITILQVTASVADMVNYYTLSGGGGGAKFSLAPIGP